MKITFTTPLDYTDGSAIGSVALLAASYIVFIDTANPPVKSYPVPVANLAAGVKQTDGSFLITVDPVADLSAPLVAGTTYFFAAEDSINGELSDETPVVSAMYQPKPNPPGNFTAA